MNKQRREWIRKLIETANDLRGEIEEVLNEEQECYDNLPENLQNSERGEIMDEAIRSLDEAQSCIEDCISNLESSIEL